MIRDYLNQKDYDKDELFKYYDEEYDKHICSDGSESKARKCFQLIYKPFDSLLDVGCGDAYFLKEFIKLSNPKRSVGTDISKPLLKIAQKNNPKLNFYRVDSKNLPFKDKEFDTAVLGEILEHVDDPIQVLKEAKRVAKKKIIITVPNEYEWDKDRGPFLPVEEVAKAQGLTVEEMAKRDNPAIEFYTKDNYRHLHHQRYYTKEMLKEHLEKAGIKNYKIGKLYTTGKDRGFAFFTCICQNFQ